MIHQYKVTLTATRWGWQAKVSYNDVLEDGEIAREMVPAPRFWRPTMDWASAAAWDWAQHKQLVSKRDQSPVVQTEDPRLYRF